MFFARLLSFSLILVLFLFLIVPVGLVISAITSVVVFIGYVNKQLEYSLSHRDQMLSIYYLKKMAKRTISKNTIDI